MKRLLLFLITLAYGSSLFSAVVDESIVRQAALKMWSELKVQNQIFGNDSISSITPIGQSNTPLLYIYNFHPQGFLIISAEDAVYPLIGYGFSGNFMQYDEKVNIAGWMKFYTDQISEIRSKNLQADAKIQSAWSYLLGQSAFSFLKGGSVGPLITTNWSQGCFYNDSCPSDQSGPCQRVVTGCVATAMAQIMKYYNFPPNGSGSHSYLSAYGTLSANFAATSYNWNQMPTSLSASNTSTEISAVAVLMSHCGISTDMQYSPGASGAYSYDALNAFMHYFNYSKDLQLLSRENYPDSIWCLMLREQLDSTRVLYYDGYGTAGHAFVCDGYQNTDYFHFNWGWAGSQNGYFYVSALNPGGMSFSTYQNAIFGIRPHLPQACQPSSILTHAKGSLSDGSSYSDYAPLSNCSWLIQPTAGVNIELSFYTFNLGAGDTVKIYDGNTTSYPLLGSYTGTNIPASLTTTGLTALVNFTSDNQNQGQGFSMAYLANFCKGYSQLTAASDTFGDGSDNFLYNDNTSCSWLIQPPGAGYVDLSFLEFSTEAGFDFVKMYDGNNNTATLLGSFSGHNLPNTVTSTGGSLFVEFTADGGVVDQGWKASYKACFSAPAPTAASNTFCQNDSLQLHVNLPPGSFNWLCNNQILPYTDSTIFVHQPGVYNIITTGGICSADTSAAITINALPAPVFTLGDDTTICQHHWLTLQAPPSYTSYLWSNTSQGLTYTIPPFSLTPGNYDVWLKVTDQNSCTGIDTIQVSVWFCEGIEEISNIIQVFPNPVTDQLNIQLPESSESSATICLYDHTGKLVKKLTGYHESSIQINTLNLSRGVYQLSIIRDNTVYRTRFIKM